jgi:hypothetical protein
MTHILSTATLLVAVSVPAFAGTESGTENGGAGQAAAAGNAEAAVVQAVRDFNTAWDRRDRAAVDRLTHADFLAVVPGGTISKTDLLEDLEDGAAPQGRKVETIVDPKATTIRFYGDTAVVVTRPIFRTQDKTETLDVPFWATYVLVRQQGAWRVTSMQSMHDLPKFEDMAPAYTLTLQPGQSARLEVDFEAGGENEVQVLDAQGKVVKTVNNRSTPEDQRSLDLTAGKDASGPATYTIRARHRVGEPSTDPPWFDSFMQTRPQPDGSLVLGFNDAWPDSDFNDARVKIVVKK